MYEFSLIVDRDACEQPYADALFELGEGDYIPEGGGTEPPVVHVFQEAESRAAAIAAATGLIEKTGVRVMGERPA